MLVTVLAALGGDYLHWWERLCVHNPKGTLKALSHISPLKLPLRHLQEGILLLLFKAIISVSSPGNDTFTTA